MSDSRWVITPLWFSLSWRSFLYHYSVYSCHLLLISSASVRTIPFLTFIVPILVRNVPLVSLIFLRRSLVFPILLSLLVCGIPIEQLKQTNTLTDICIKLFSAFPWQSSYIFPTKNQGSLLDKGLLCLFQVKESIGKWSFDLLVFILQTKRKKYQHPPT